MKNNNKNKGRNNSPNKNALKRKSNPGKEAFKNNRLENKPRPKGRINLRAGNFNPNPIRKNSYANSESEATTDYSDSDSLSEEEEGDEELAESEQTQPKKKKKTSVKHGTAEFAATMAHLISQKPGSLASQTPVLSKSKDVASKIEEGRLEYKARRLLAAERKKILDKDHVKYSPMTLDYEKKLRSIATRGVIMIFNAMQTQQRVADLDELAQPSVKTEVAKMSKASFLSMLKSGSAASK